MRFNVAILSCLIFEITADPVEKETLSPYSVIDYRVPLQHPQMYALANRSAGASFYFEKLGVDYPMHDLDSIRATQLFKDWTQDSLSWKLLSQNMNACELARTRIANIKFNYSDSVTDFGKACCYEQCFNENFEFYKFLSDKLQDLTMKNPLCDVALNSPRWFNGTKQISQCTKLAVKRYKCECFYRNYQMKVSPEFEHLFGQIILETRQVENLNREELEEKYGIPMKLVGFLIVYHLLPDDMFPYLVWWTHSEGVNVQQ